MDGLEVGDQKQVTVRVIDFPAEMPGGKTETRYSVQEQINGGGYSPIPGEPEAGYAKLSTAVNKAVTALGGHTAGCCPVALTATGTVVEAWEPVGNRFSGVIEQRLAELEEEVA